MLRDKTTPRLENKNLNQLELRRNVLTNVPDGGDNVNAEPTRPNVCNS